MSVTAPLRNAVTADGVNMKFKVGDKVKIVVPGNGVLEVDNGLGMIGTVIDVDNDCCQVESATFKYGPSWCLKEDKLELVTEPAVPVFIVPSNTCPRCGGEMIEKQSEYCGIINKCRKCGYC